MECPLISSVQKITVYETKAGLINWNRVPGGIRTVEEKDTFKRHLKTALFDRYYIVGSNSKETSFRVIKIDRTEPKELHIHDDKHVYSQTEMKNVLLMMESGNRSANKQKQHSKGPLKTSSAYGIIGFVRFLEGYYMVLIKSRSKVCILGGHSIYKIEDTMMLYIPNNSVRYTHPDEQRYLKMFQSVDLSSNFYFSYSYDLTHTLQYNMSSSVDPNLYTDVREPENEDMVYGVKTMPEQRFIWNKFLIELLEKEVHSDWLLYIVYGFIAQSNLYIFGKSVYLTLIARRSNEFAGTRFLKRGANSQGAVANEVETEQIVYDTNVTQLQKSKVSSFVQMRGSIPVYWSQDVSKMVPKPPITIDQRDPYFHTAGLHFNKCLRRYGAPIILLNLIKRHEKRAHESLLCEEFKDCKNYLNQFLPPDKQIIYIGFDMAHYTKKKTNNVLDRLAGISKCCIKQTGFFFHSPNMKTDFRELEEFEGVLGCKTPTGSKQTGIVRTNCVDCLDRTNTAQFALGKCALAYQLCALGVLSLPELNFDTDCIMMLEELYEDEGDTIALQYGGSHLVHRIEGYRKIAPWRSHSLDILQTLSRYYSNAFSDLEKQQATNLFLGLFLPKENQLNVWDLPTDFYLHNLDAAGEKVARKSYTMWCEENVFDYLPLPYEEATKPYNTDVQKFSRLDERVDMFFDYYKPHEYTNFKRTFDATSLKIRNFRPKIIKNANPSPFEKRIVQAISKDESQELNPNISGKDSTASTTSNMSEDSTSSGSSVEGDILTSSSDSEEEYMNNNMEDNHHDDDGNLYNLNLTQFEEDENVQEMYRGYVNLGNACKEPLVQHKNALLATQVSIEPLGDYKSDIYNVDEPTVSNHSIELYKQYVHCGVWGASEPADANKEVYKNYIRQLYL